MVLINLVKLTGLHKSPLRLLKDDLELHELMSDLAAGDICWWWPWEKVKLASSRGTSKKGLESLKCCCCCWEAAEAANAAIAAMCKLAAAWKWKFGRNGYGMEAES